MDLRSTAMEECTPLPTNFDAHSFTNRIDRPVTVYQDVHCSSEADFTTYPGGTNVPQAPYIGRAIKIWQQ